MWGYMGDQGWWWWGFGALHMLLFWGVLIFGIVLLVRWLSRSPTTTFDRPYVKTALDILKERYARGEIGKEEFEQKKRDLTD